MQRIGKKKKNDKKQQYSTVFEYWKGKQPRRVKTHSFVYFTTRPLRRPSDTIRDCYLRINIYTQYTAAIRTRSCTLCVCPTRHAYYTRKWDEDDDIIIRIL